jgi:class 3 adenylate cyclase/tetratricopeptide (TPR) repeat protein
MITCSNCHQANRPGAFFCKHCGHALACPRCRMILQDPGDYCDNCGQALAADTLFAAAPLSQSQPRPLESPKPEPAPEPPPPPATPAASDQERPVASGQSYLDQFVPHELMAKVEAARAGGGMEGERRVVTTLFCDVKGSTAAAERLDPEEWTEIINGAFEHMIKPVYKYEGTVARLMGDAILAFFGAPIAHEDDPQRAVLAGLDIVANIDSYREGVESKWGIDFNVRVGINTGVVVVGAVGSDLRMEYTAMGDAVNLASRMEQTAKPGTVQIAEETYKLVAPLFDFEELGGIEVKGKEKPVLAYRVLRQKAIPGRLRGFGGTSTPLVGRQDALRRLTTAVERVQHGNGQILFITGEVGLGKSRLIEELSQEWDEAIAAFREGASQEGASQGEVGEGGYPFSRWYSTFSLSYETTRPYSLFQHLLRQVFGATQGDPPAVLKRKLDDFVSANVPAEEMGPVRTVLEALFGLVGDGETTLEGEAFKRQLYKTVAFLVSQWTADAPGVIVADDVHWADPASIDLLMHLFRLSDRLPVLFVCALRPERSSPSWQLAVKADREYPHRYTEIRLEPLTHEESRTLASHLLGNDQLPESLIESILVKAAGNPFFIEEVVRALIDNGALIPNQSSAGWDVSPDVEMRQIAIPDSLQSTLMARIDRLDDAQKRTLQMAALIGRSFYYRVLQRMTQTVGDEGSPKNGSLDQQLGELQRMELIVQAARIPELEYVFRQALVQESAYKTILHKQRREYHLKVGEAMEALFPEQRDEHAIVLAHHFSEAGDHARALKYHAIAANMAFRLYANAEAAEHYTQALEAAAKLPAGDTSTSVERLTHLYARRGRALELDARIREAVENYEAMRQKAQQLDAKEMELAALMSMATQYATPTSIYNFELAESLSDQAIQLARDLNDRPAEAKILWNLSNMNRFSGYTEEALQGGEKALAIARELDLREQIAFSLNDLSHLYSRTGRYEKSKAALQEANDLWRELNNLPMLTDSLSTASYVYTFTGDYDDAVAFSEEALGISESIANIWGLSYSQFVVGKVYWERGEPEKAIRVMSDSIHYAEKAGFTVAQAYTRADLAMAYGRLGDIDQAFTIAKEAQNYAVDDRRSFEPYVLSQLARLHLMNGDAAAAGEAVGALRVEGRPIHLNRPDVVTAAECELSHHRGNYAEAIRLLEKRLAQLRQYGMRCFLPETLYLLGQAFAAASQPDQALSTLEEGLQEARSLGSRWGEWQLLVALADLEGEEQASLRRAKALECVTFVAENVGDPELRTSFLNRPEIQKLTALRAN